MKIKVIETFIKAFGVDLMSRERTGSEMEIPSVSHLSQPQESLSLSVPYLSLLLNGVGYCFCLQWKFSGILEESSV